jgi:solute carrier family 27 fatty acid transporter 1/4
MGSCGFIPLLNKIFPIYPIFIIRIDAQMRPIRDRNGFCQKCAPGEKGLLVGVIGDRVLNSYNGYAYNSEASKAKIIENVLKKGQHAFNSGDLMYADSFGYVYFCDRLGDTFRWRGENVATIEVEDVISGNLNSREVVVYGVQVPGQEGRAGMAALNCREDEVNLVELNVNLTRDLPSYAKPVFIRFVQEIEHNGILGFITIIGLYNKI